MNLAERSYADMVNLVNAFVGAYAPSLAFTVTTSTPSKTLVADRGEVDQFFASLTPQITRRKILIDFVMFQLAKPLRTFSWLASQFSNQLPGIIMSSETPDVMFSHALDSQNVEMFMRSLICRDTAGVERRLETDCEAGSTDWVLMKAMIEDILQVDLMRFDP